MPMGGLGFRVYLNTKKICRIVACWAVFGVFGLPTFGGQVGCLVSGFIGSAFLDGRGHFQTSV